MQLQDQLKIKPDTAISQNHCYQQCFLSDNMELMKTIESNTIDLIYCDILYGTGRKFKDYQDLKPNRIEIENHYIPRLKEMHRILKPTGSIYLQMDTRINHWIRFIMDNIFSYDNFRNEIIFSYSGGGISKTNFPKKSDRILFYTKSKNYYFNNEKKPYSDMSSKNLLWKHRNQKRVDELNNGTPITDVWSDLKFKINYQEQEFTGYTTQKTKELLKRIVLASTNEGDLVADFYAGSFTTAEVCKDLNRNFIGCDINPLALEISKQRLA